MTDPVLDTLAQMEYDYHNASGKNGMTHAEFDEAMEAVHEGRAMDLTRYYLCPPTGIWSKEGDGPLRGIVRTYTNRSADPTEVAVLTCGHEVI
jgi:hypothetical protein